MFMFTYSDCLSKEVSLEITMENQLTIPVVSVGASVYYNVVVTIGKVLSVGGTCSGVSTCYSALNTETAVSATTAGATTASAMAAGVF